MILDEESTTGEFPAQLLNELGDRPSVDVYSTHPTASSRVTLGDPLHQRDLLRAVLASPRANIEVAIPALSSIRARTDCLAGEYEMARTDVERLLLFDSLCRTNGALDYLVVGEHVLSGPLRRHLRQSVTPSEGLALLGLNLRAHGDFAISGSRVISAEDFYRAVVFRHIDQLAFWASATITTWVTGDHRPLSLLDGVATRIARALRARDYLQVRLRAHDYRSVWSEVLFFFDVALVQLMGAFDSLARFLGGLLDINGDKASWRSRGKRGWLQALSVAAPEIAEHAQPGQELGDTVDLVADLRNFIHEAPLSAEVRTGDGHVYDWGEGLVAVRLGEESTRMLAAAERLGGLRKWGISDRSRDLAVTLDPGLFAEQAIRSTIAALAKTLALTPRPQTMIGDPANASSLIPDNAAQTNAAALFGLCPGGLPQDRITAA
jgi:hypothetical protein